MLHGLLGFNLLNIYKSRIFLDDQIQQNIFRTKISLFTSSCQLWIYKNTVIYFSFSVVLCTSQKVVRTSGAWLVSNQLMRGELGELWPTRSVSLVDGFMSPLSDDFNSLLSTVKNIFQFSQIFPGLRTWHTTSASMKKIFFPLLFSVNSCFVVLNPGILLKSLGPRFRLLDHPIALHIHVNGESEEEDEIIIPRETSEGKDLYKGR